MNKMFYKNKNTNNIITEEEYLALIDRETKNACEEMEDERKEEIYDNNFSSFYSSWINDDSDFIQVDEDGNDYWN
jgi:hypothetical protein